MTQLRPFEGENDPAIFTEVKSFLKALNSGNSEPIANIPAIQVAIAPAAMVIKTTELAALSCQHFSSRKLTFSTQSLRSGIKFMQTARIISQICERKLIGNNEAISGTSWIVLNYG